MAAPNVTAEAGAARLRPAGRAGCCVASVTASRRLHFRQALLAASRRQPPRRFGLGTRALAAQLRSRGSTVAGRACFQHALGSTTNAARIPMVRTATLHGKILALLKEYYWRQVPNSFEHQFFTGGDRLRPFSGIGLTWWRTRRAFDVRAELANMLVSARPELGLDAESIDKLIEDVLTENATNRNLFKRDSFMAAATLFESRRSSPAEVAAGLLALIWDAAVASVHDWLVVVPLPRIRCESVNIGFDGLSILAVGDDAAWKEISADFASGHRWNSKTGHGDPRDARIMGPLRADSWLICRASGTSAGARLRARECMRTWLALMFAALHQRDIDVLMRSAATNSRSGLIFPETFSRGGYIHTTIGNLTPPVADDVTLSADIIAVTQRWYRARQAMSTDRRKRATVASQFVHYALVAGDLEQFVHFFIALDAMFGVRGCVEQSIAASVRRVFDDSPEAERRATKLFDLRSELLHGGASSVADWSGYSAYVKHYRTSPNKDVAAMALRALATYGSENPGA